MASPSKLGNILKYIDKMTGGVRPKAWLFKFVPLVLIQACSVFAYTILKNTKNSVITRVSPTETFQWLKILVILPLALFFPLLLKRILELLKDKKDKVPYVLIAIFATFYLVFALVIFPFSNILQFPWFAEWLPNFQPFGFKIFSLVPKNILTGIAHTFGYWANSLFYGLSEFWAVIGINFLAWGIANQICSENETKIFYPSFGILSNIGGYFGARIMGGSKLSALTDSNFVPALRNIIFIATSAIIFMGLIYFFIEKFVIQDPTMIEAKKESKKKAKPENGLQMVLRNPYLQKIAIMVVSYAVIIFLVEQCWYEWIIKSYGNSVYTTVLAKVAEINSLMTILLSLFSTFVLTSFPWVVRAMIPVIMVGFSAVGFFIFYLLGRSPEAVSFLASSGLMSIVPIQLTVILGSFQNISARCTKYSIFDSTKEQLFSSSLDSDVKLQGKGAVDVAFGRTAKSSGAVIMIGLVSAHSFYMSFVRNFFGNTPQKDKTEQVSSLPAQANQAKGEKIAHEIGHKAIKIDFTSDGRYVIKFTDPSTIEHKDFDRVIDESGKVTFIQKKSEVVQIKTEEKQTQVVKEEKSDSTIRDTVPAVFAIVVVMVLLWSYAVITIAPMHESNLIESRKLRDPDAEDAISTEGAKNPFNLKTILQLLLISGVLCTGLYIWASKAIGVILSEASTTKVDTKPLKYRLEEQND